MHVNNIIQLSQNLRFKQQNIDTILPNYISLHMFNTRYYKISSFSLSSIWHTQNTCVSTNSTHPKVLEDIYQGWKIKAKFPTLYNPIVTLNYKKEKEFTTDPLFFGMLVGTQVIFFRSHNYISRKVIRKCP